jgi:serine/threonine protein kinase
MNNISEYRELYHYDEKHSLVISQITGDVRMMKTLSHYDESVYVYLCANPNKFIPQIYGIFKDSNNNLIVIEEFIQGNTFDMLINDKTLPDKKKLNLFLELLEGLSLLHNAPNPIIHRDLKPSNLMVTEKGEVKILDYDAAKVYKPNGSGDTTFLGTDGVAAPEQYGFMQSDPRSDVYAVGKMLSAAFPNDGRIQQIAAKASSFDPANRYSNARELSDALTRKIHPKTKLKNPFPPPGFRTRKWWKMIIATFCYLWYIIAVIGFNAHDTLILNIAVKIFFIVYPLFVVDMCFSWTGIYDSLPFMMHKNKFLQILFKFLYIVLGTQIIIVITAILIVIAEDIQKIIMQFF